MGYIYKITNDINDKIYIGLTTTTLEERFNKHKYKATEYCKKKRSHQPLYAAINKYGFDKFHIHLIEECEDSQLAQREIYWIQYYGSYGNGYNGSLGGEGTSHFDYAKIYEYLSQNELSCQEIAQLFHCSKQTVYNVAHKYNFPLKRKKNKIKNQSNIKQEATPAKAVNQYDKQHNFIQSFKSVRLAANWVVNNKLCKSNNDCAEVAIRNCCNKKPHRHTAYGYIWEFKNIKII